MTPSIWTHHATTLSLLVGLAACRGGGDADGAGGAGGGASTGAGTSDATVLACPNPGQLPFTLESSGWVDPDNESLAASEERYKDEASDRLGSVSLSATTYDAIDAASTPAAPRYAGRKARAPLTSGLESNGLPGENVSLWVHDAEAGWTSLGRTKTDGLGDFSFDLGAAVTLAPGQAVYSVLEADGSCAPHYDALFPSGTPVILTDIDGTMTLSDEELFSQIADGSYDPKENASASAMMNLWSDKGYPIVYLTARPHAFRAETRAWLDAHGFPVGAVVTASSLVFDESAREYKRSWVNRVLTDFGWEVVAAYGNATSDIDAYEDAGVPKEITFIVGPEAGAAGTVAIEGNDFSSHVSDFVQPYPDAP